MNIYEIVYNKIFSAIEQLAKNEKWQDLKLKNVTAEIPHDPNHGDIATNAAMILAPQLKKSPRDIAKLIADLLKQDDMFENIAIAAAGFINFVLHSDIWQKELYNIIEKGDLYAKSNIGKGREVNIEYASPNPTGPMHVGHASGSIYGDALASLLEYSGYRVTRECYINDAGNQIEQLVESIYLRYLELFGHRKEFPENGYPGEYIIDAAKHLKSQYKDAFVNQTQEKWHPIIREFAIEEMLKLIKKDLEALGIKHDIFFYETLLHKENRVQILVDKLKNLNLVYKGCLPKPKGKNSSEWEEREQLLFKSTQYGDDIDRPLQKSDGTWTYFAADAAYLEDKINRKFAELVLILGPDHAGYKKRMYAICSALNKGNCILDIRFSQLVVFMQNGKPLKMSKRAGNFVSIEQILNLVGKDVLRFMVLTRKSNSAMEFDVEKVKEQSKDNPVFYVQYAHARGCSVLSNAKECANEAFRKAKENFMEVDLTMLKTSSELNLIKYLSYWPKQVRLAAENHDPQRLVAYLQNLAAKFHAFWNVGNKAQDLRFIVQDNIKLTAARLVLLEAVLKIISNGLRLIGVSPVEKM